MSLPASTCVSPVQEQRTHLAASASNTAAMAAVGHGAIACMIGKMRVQASLRIMRGSKERQGAQEPPLQNPRAGDGGGGGGGGRATWRRRRACGSLPLPFCAGYSNLHSGLPTLPDLQRLRGGCPRLCRTDTSGKLPLSANTPDLEACATAIVQFAFWGFPGRPRTRARDRLLPGLQLQVTTVTGSDGFGNANDDRREREVGLAL